MKEKTEKRIRILFFIPGLSEGGAEKVLCSLVNNMDQSKFDITVQTIDKFDQRQYLKDGIHYKAINQYKTDRGKKLFTCWFRLCAELGIAYCLFVKGDYDIEVAYLETAATKMIAQSTNKKSAKLAWVHCDLSKKEGMSHSVEKVRKQYARYDKIVCVSRDVEAGFHKLYGKDFKTVVLHNVIDEDEILRRAAEPAEWETEPEEKRLLAVGRLTKQKNFKYLIKTCGRLRDSGYQFKLNILGEGPERERLEEQIRTLKLEKYVTLKGFTKNPYPWMKTADLIVCSSRYEGISTVVQEALILGKVVVTTPCTGMKELLGDSKYGLIVEDSEKGLYNGIARLLDEPELMQKYNTAAKDGKELFSKKQVVGQTEAFFQDSRKK